MDLAHILAQQDMVLKISFGILVLMSIISWSVICIRGIFAYKENKKLKLSWEIFEKSSDLGDARIRMQDDNSSLALIIKEAFDAYKQYSSNDGFIGISSQLPLKDFLHLKISNAISRQMHRFEGGLTALASIGAVSPFIGLFGTVWGIFNTLMDIAQQGQVSIATVSAPIGEALVATAMGLFVAIPAVLAYNAITRINKQFSHKYENFSHEFYVHLLNYKEK